MKSLKLAVGLAAIGLALSVHVNAATFGANAVATAEASVKTTPIMSVTELDHHIGSTTALSSPLGKLSDSGLSRFIASMKFNEKGLTSYSFAELEGVPATDVHKILALFGVERTTKLIQNTRVLNMTDLEIMNGPVSPDGASNEGVATSVKNKTRVESQQSNGIFSPWDDADEFAPGDREGMECSSRATCSPKYKNICTPNC